jgi:hypothetical protein
LLPALAPHRVPRNHCEERVSLVLFNGHGTLPSVHGVRVSHSHETQAPEPRKPATKQAGCPPFRDGNSESPPRNQIFPRRRMLNRHIECVQGGIQFGPCPLARDVMIADLLGTLARPEDYVRGVLKICTSCLSQRSGNLCVSESQATVSYPITQLIISMKLTSPASPAKDSETTAWRVTAGGAKGLTCPQLFSTRSLMICRAAERSVDLLSSVKSNRPSK